MASTTQTGANPPRGSFSVWQRLLRGYGPLAVFVVILLLMSLLIPSKVPDKAEAVSSNNNTSSGSNNSSGGLTTGSTVAGEEGAAPGAGGGTQSAAGAPGGNPAAVPGVSPCPGDQVPGDPYSPPCFQWNGDNGGNTSKGVTKDEIIISFRSLNERGFQQTLAELAGASLSDGPDDVRRTVEAMGDYFNKNFQFYGRKMKIVFYNGVGSNTQELLGKGRDKAEADATKVADEIGAFADASATSEPLSDALFRRGVMGFGDPYLSREWHVQRRPFTWSLATDGTRVAGLAGEYTAARLAGKPATLAGGPLKGQPRKLATLAPENSWYQESVDYARSIVTKAGFDPGVNIKYVLDLGTMSNQSANIIPQLKSQGVTTVLCGCDPIMPVFLSGAAAREGYYPEFIITGTALTDTDIVGQLWDKEFRNHAFGVSSLQEPVPQTDTIAYEAYKTVRDDEPAFTVDLIYYQMYMIAIGLQMAGPNLTPQNFEAGMFAYPPKLGPAGLWRFGEGDYTAANDVREIYFDNTAVSKYNGRTGAFVDSEPGVRYESGQIVKGDPKVPAK